MISVAKLNFERNGVENRYASHDVGAAVAYAAIQATALGLFIHQMAGFDVPKTNEVYGIPNGYEPVEAIATRLAPRTRKSLEQFVFSGSWNQASPLVKQ